MANKVLTGSQTEMTRMVAHKITQNPSRYNVKTTSWSEVHSWAVDV